MGDWINSHSIKALLFGTKCCPYEIINDFRRCRLSALNGIQEVVVSIVPSSTNNLEGLQVLTCRPFFMLNCFFKRHTKIWTLAARLKCSSASGIMIEHDSLLAHSHYLYRHFYVKFKRIGLEHSVSF